MPPSLYPHAARCNAESGAGLAAPRRGHHSQTPQPLPIGRSPGSPGVARIGLRRALRPIRRWLPSRPRRDCPPAFAPEIFAFAAFDDGESRMTAAYRTRLDLLRRARITGAIHLLIKRPISAIAPSRQLTTSHAPPASRRERFGGCIGGGCR